MTERLIDIEARIRDIRQLSAVVKAMRGIAAARSQQARTQLAAVDGYAATIAIAIGRAVSLVSSDRSDETRGSMRPALVLFCAEQGFAGAFSERVLDAAGIDVATSELFLIGTRGAAIAAERNIIVSWKSAMPSHSPGIPKLADGIAEALYARIAAGHIDQLDTLFTQWEPVDKVRIIQRRLFPLDMTIFPKPNSSDSPLLNLAPETLLSELVANYIHAQLCTAALHAFAAENEARIEAMTSAHQQIERRFSTLQARQRLVRQEEITAEIIELTAGDAVSRIDAG